MQHPWKTAKLSPNVVDNMEEGHQVQEGEVSEQEEVKRSERTGFSASRFLQSNNWNSLHEMQQSALLDMDTL